MDAVSFGARVHELAERSPDKSAIILIGDGGPERRISWQELDVLSTQIAWLLADRGIDGSSFVAIGLPNSIEHVLATVASWKLGSCVLPLNPRLPKPERDGLLGLVKPAVVVGDWSDANFPTISLSELRQANRCSTRTLPDRIPRPGFALASGGSTGSPKLIINPFPVAFDPQNFPFGLPRRAGMRAGQVQVVVTPLYHSLGLGVLTNGIFGMQLIVLLERFNPRTMLEAIERHQVNFAALVPTMMQRILKDGGVEDYDLSSLESIWHTGARCPDWVKLRFIELLGSERIYESFGATEGFGAMEIRGDDWLRHRGSVGRPVQCDLRILDEGGRGLPPGVVGEIFVRPHTSAMTFRYLGGESARMSADGFYSVGDLGHVDEAGYLYPADRRVDVIITGGLNVYPAEIEGALVEHPGVADVAVIGLYDDEWGRCVHAIVQKREASNSAVDIAELDAYLRARLSPHKVPKSYEFVEAIPRTEAGKIRRSALVAERESSPI